MAVAPTADGPNPQEFTQSAQGASGGSSSGGQDLVLRVLGAVGTGVGILGFVTLFGGAILWVRANEAGLPANEAVAVVPRGVLVTTGASFLVPAVLLALLVVVLIAAVHIGFSLPARYKTRKLSASARRLRYEADEAKRVLEPAEQIAASSRELAKDLSTIVDDASQTSAAATQVPRLMGQAEAQQQEAQIHEQKARELRTSAEDLNAKAQQEEAALKFALSNTPLLDSIQRVAECTVAVAVLALLPLFAYGNLEDVGPLHGLILILVALAAAALSLATYIASEKFLWFGVVAFISVGIYTGCATYFRTIQNPKVEPAAALLGDRPPVTGLFVADTSSDLYLGTFAHGNLPARLLVIPHSQVTDLEIGSLLDPRTARAQAIALAQEECRQEIEQAGSRTAATPVCTRRQEAALSALQIQH